MLSTSFKLCIWKHRTDLSTVMQQVSVSIPGDRAGKDLCSSEISKKPVKGENSLVVFLGS